MNRREREAKGLEPLTPGEAFDVAGEVAARMRDLLGIGPAVQIESAVADETTGRWQVKGWEFVPTGLEVDGEPTFRVEEVAAEGRMTRQQLRQWARLRRRRDEALTETPAATEAA